MTPCYSSSASARIASWACERPLSAQYQDMNPPAVLWDVDFDFFLDSERTVLEDRNKDYWLRPEILLDAHRSAPRTPVVHHRECLRLWDQAALRGWVCIHFDAHPDLFDEADPGLGNLPLGRRGDCVTDGNYLLIALRDGILARVVWVAPDWQAVEDYRARFDHAIRSWPTGSRCCATGTS